MTACFGTRGEEDFLGNRCAHLGIYGNHYYNGTVMGTNRVGSGSFSSRCCVFQRTHEERSPYSATLYPTSFTLDSRLVLVIRAAQA